MKERKATEEEREKGNGERVVIFKKEVLGWGVTEYQQTLFHIPLCLLPKKKQKNKKSLRNNQGK